MLFWCSVPSPLSLSQTSPHSSEPKLTGGEGSQAEAHVPTVIPKRLAGLSFTQFKTTLGTACQTSCQPRHIFCT